MLLKTPNSPSIKLTLVGKGTRVFLSTGSHYNVLVFKGFDFLWEHLNLILRLNLLYCVPQFPLSCISPTVNPAVTIPC